MSETCRIFFWETKGNSGFKKITSLLFALEVLRRAARRHGRLAVQGLRADAVVREVCLGQGGQRQRLAHRGAQGRADMVALKGDKEIGDKINKIIARLAEKNDLKGVIDQADFNDEGKLGSGKEMQDRLSKLVAIFERLDFRANRAEGDDLLGDAYEYLFFAGDVLFGRLRPYLRKYWFAEFDGICTTEI